MSDDYAVINRIENELNRLKQIYQVHCSWDLSVVQYLVSVAEEKGASQELITQYKEKLKYQRTLPLRNNRWIWSHREIEVLIKETKSK